MACTLSASAHTSANIHGAVELLAHFHPRRSPLTLACPCCSLPCAPSLAGVLVSLPQTVLAQLSQMRGYLYSFGRHEYQKKYRSAIASPKGYHTEQVVVQFYRPAETHRLSSISLSRCPCRSRMRVNRLRRAGSSIGKEALGVGAAETAQVFLSCASHSGRPPLQPS